MSKNYSDLMFYLVPVLSAEENHSILVALQSDNPWNHDLFSSSMKRNLLNVKDKIKRFHLLKNKNKCCYCRKSLLDAAIEQDREHILPKNKFKSLCYDINNLSVACKRCNMTYKGSTTKHVVCVEGIRGNHLDGNGYTIPHPNIDVYTDHIERLGLDVGDCSISLYKIYTPKGQNLYEFVRLDKLCADELTALQGGKYDNVIDSFLSLNKDGL